MAFLFKGIARRTASVAAPAMFKLYFRKAPKFAWKGGRIPVTVSFDYDLDADTAAIPKLVELFDSHKLPASHACRGDLIRKSPSAYAKLVARGDEIINHTQNHPENFISLDKAVKKKEISDCHNTVEEVLGVEMSGFRTPHFGDLHSPDVYEILEEIGYAYSSSTNLTKTKSFGLPYKPSKKNFLEPGEPSYSVVELPIMSCPAHYFPVFDSWHCFERPGAHAKEGEFLKMFRKAVGMALKHGFYLNFYFDPRHVADKKDFEPALELVAAEKKLVALTSKKVVELYLSSEKIAGH